MKLVELRLRLGGVMQHRHWYRRTSVGRIDLELAVEAFLMGDRRWPGASAG